MFALFELDTDWHRLTQIKLSYHEEICVYLCPIQLVNWPRPERRTQGLPHRAEPVYLWLNLPATRCRPNREQIWRVHSRRQRSVHRPLRTWPSRSAPGTPTHRKPILLLRLSGVLSLRVAARTLFSLLFQLPPRSTLLTCPHAAVGDAFTPLPLCVLLVFFPSL
jgi:hypothetical protein